MTDPTMVCAKCGKPMYRQDIDMGSPNGADEAWHCPDRLDGKHGDWLSMPVFVMRVSDDEFERIAKELQSPQEPTEALIRLLAAKRTL